MLKKIVSLAAAIAVAMIIFMVVEYVNHVLYPLPAGIDVSDKVALAAFIKDHPAALVLVAIGWVVGSFVAGWLVTKISGTQNATLALIAGCILTLSGVMNFLMIPHPLWFVVLGMITFIPLAFTGYLVAKQKNLKTL